jgi:DNA-binding winged helix-turn-helix (wHTH) protein
MHATETEGEAERAATFLRSLGYAVAPPRRRPAVNSAVLRLDADERLLICGTRSVNVSPNQSRVLRSLLDAGGRWCTAEQIQREVWGPAPPQTGRLYVLMYGVREKLKIVTGSDDATIVSFPRLGYRLALRGTWSGNVTKSL